MVRSKYTIAAANSLQSLNQQNDPRPLVIPTWRLSAVSCLVESSTHTLRTTLTWSKSSTELRHVCCIEYLGCTFRISHSRSHRAHGRLLRPAPRQPRRGSDSYRAARRRSNATRGAVQKRYCAS